MKAAIDYVMDHVPEICLLLGVSGLIATLIILSLKV